MCSESGAMTGMITPTNDNPVAYFYCYSNFYAVLVNIWISQSQFKKICCHILRCFFQL